MSTIAKSALSSESRVTQTLTARTCFLQLAFYAFVIVVCGVLATSLPGRLWPSWIYLAVLAAGVVCSPVYVLQDIWTICQTRKSLRLTPLQTEARSLAWLRWAACVLTGFAVPQLIQREFPFYTLLNSPDATPGMRLLVIVGALVLAIGHCAPLVLLWKKVAASRRRPALLETGAVLVEISATQESVTFVAPMNSPEHWWTDNGTRAEINEVKAERSK